MNRYPKRQFRRRLAFSLIEVIFVVTIIGILATVIMQRISTSSDAAKEKSCFHNRTEINSAWERFGVVTGAFPTDLSDLDVPDYFPGGIPVCPVSGAAYTMNATTERVDGHTNSGNH